MPIPYQNQRNIQDAAWATTTAFALPAAASTTVTMSNPALFNLGTDPFDPEEVDAVLSVPALSTTIAPDTRTFTYRLQTSTVSNFATTVHTMDKVFTGAGGVGIAAQDVHFRLPPDCPQYIRWQIISGASTTDASALTATASLRF